MLRVEPDNLRDFAARGHSGLPTVSFATKDERKPGLSREVVHAKLDQRSGKDTRLAPTNVQRRRSAEMPQALAQQPMLKEQP